jgi:hypothetical protein
MVTAQFLLEGSVYALEQCGLLLRDATALFKAGSFASSILMAGLARESLDKAGRLRGLRERVLHGRGLVLPEIDAEFGEQDVEGVLAGAGADLRAPHNPRGEARINKQLTDASSAGGYRQGDLFAELARREQARLTREEREALRAGCLHVRPDGGGVHWSRPKDHSREEARRFLLDALSDYAREKDRIETGLCRPEDAGYVSAVRAWSDRPKLPTPAWPSW